MLRRAGVAPTGDPFNAIEVDELLHRAPNPMVNSGAIAITDMVDGADLEKRTDTVLTLFVVPTMYTWFAHKDQPKQLQQETETDAQPEAA